MTESNDSNSKKCVSLIADTDQFIRQVIVPHVSNLSFEVDGVLYNARHVPNGATAQLVIWGTLGFLPYSVTSVEKRENLITLLEGTRALPVVTFGIDREMKIIVSGTYTIPTPPTPTYLFHPLTQFLQESRAFTRLIGSFL
ncbi:MAG: hypothetical protein WC612_05190 [Bdellovibrionales bacterium]|jgi:hypothetical protein